MGKHKEINFSRFWCDLQFDWKIKYVHPSATTDKSGSHISLQYKYKPKGTSACGKQAVEPSTLPITAAPWKPAQPATVQMHSPVDNGGRQHNRNVKCLLLFPIYRRFARLDLSWWTAADLWKTAASSLFCFIGWRKLQRIKSVKHSKKTSCSNEESAFLLLAFSTISQFDDCVFFHINKPVIIFY